MGFDMWREATSSCFSSFFIDPDASSWDATTAYRESSWIAWLYFPGIAWVSGYARIGHGRKMAECSLKASPLGAALVEADYI